MSKRTSIAIIILAAAIVAFASVRQVLTDSKPEGSLNLAALGDSLPSSIASTDEAIAFFEGRVQRDPLDFISYASLGRMHLRRGQETGDVDAYLRAEAGFERALELQPGYPSARAYLASTYFSQHRFEEALALSRDVYDASPDSLQGLATMGDAYLELGRYDEAGDAYFELLRLEPAPAVLSRLSHLAHLNGDTDEALELLSRAAQEEADSGQPKESVAWYLARLGALRFGAGKLEEAAKHYQASLDALDGYHVALAGLGKVRAAQGRYDKAIALYERAVSIVPEPASLAALGDLYARAGDAERARLQYDTVGVIARLAAINRQVYNRELVLFYADHEINLAEALALAEREIAVRKDIYGYDALAWALYKNGRVEEAADAIVEALRLGTQDASLYYHAGMIYRGLGDAEQARSYLSRALAINPGFSVLQAEQARIALREVEKVAASLGRSQEATR